MRTKWLGMAGVTASLAFVTSMVGAQALSSGDAKFIDREYVREMVKDHKQDVAEFRRMSQNAKDPELRAWVTKTLPTLEEHLRMVQEIDRQLSAAR